MRPGISTAKLALQLDACRAACREPCCNASLASAPTGAGPIAMLTTYGVPHVLHRLTARIACPHYVVHHMCISPNRSHYARPTAARCVCTGGERSQRKNRATSFRITAHGGSRGPMPDEAGHHATRGIMQCTLHGDQPRAARSRCMVADPRACGSPRSPRRWAAAPTRQPGSTPCTARGFSACSSRRWSSSRSSPPRSPPRSHQLLIAGRYGGMARRMTRLGCPCAVRRALVVQLVAANHGLRLLRLRHGPSVIIY
jgi:hypothetical protein